MRAVAVLVAACVLLSVTARAEAKDKVKLLIEEANALYSNKRLDQALEKYDSALAESFDPKIISVINFNKATVLYIKDDYEKAIASFTRALATDDKRLEAKSSYNLGNSYYRLSELYADKSIDKAIELCGQALHYYKFAIEPGVRLPSAVYNYEYVKKKLDYYNIKKDLQDGKAAKRHAAGDKEDGQQEEGMQQNQQQDQQQKQSQDQQNQQQEQSKQLQDQQKQQQSQLQDQQKQQQQKSDDLQKQQQQQTQSLEDEQQKQKQQLEDEFQKKQEQLQQQRKGEDLQDKLDELNQQKQQQQQELKDQQQKQSQDQQNQQQKQSQDQQKQQADKKELDSDSPLDYTKDEQAQTQEDSAKQDRMTKEEAERLLDAYRRKERGMPSDIESKRKTKDRAYKDW